MDVSGVASEDRAATPGKLGVDDPEDEKDKAQSQEPLSRDPRSPMDP